MTEKISGVVEAVSKPKDVRTKNGAFKRVGFKLGETWYNSFGKTVPEVRKGDSVTFEASEGEYGWDIKGEIAVANAPQAPRTGDGRPVVERPYDVGIKVGHAITNAVSIVGPIAVGDDEAAYAKSIEKWARFIIRISNKLNENFSTIAGNKPAAPAVVPPPTAPVAPPAPPAVNKVDDFDDDVPF